MKLDFSEAVQNVAKQYVRVYHGSYSVREKHNHNMRTFDEIGKEVGVFKEIADCIETLLWAEEQPEDL